MKAGGIARRAAYRLEGAARMARPRLRDRLVRPGLEVGYFGRARLLSAGVNPRQTGPQTYGEATDEMLVLWSAQGDRRAFDEIVLRHGAFALRVASRVIPDKVIAEDVVQEAMVRAWSQASRFDAGRAQFRTWLYRIIVNLAIDQRRRMTPDQLPEDYDAIDEGPGAEERLAVHERDLALRAALGTLPPRQRAALTLVYDEGVSGAEAGRILGLSAKAVERLLARARDHLRERMRSHGGRKE